MPTRAAARPAGARRPSPRSLPGFRSLRPLAAVVIVLTSAACSTVPPGGNVFAARGGNEGDPLSQPYVRILAASPRPKSAPRDIVEGFLAAAASFDDPMRAVARQYLTGDAQRTWSPFDAVTIYDHREITPSDLTRDDLQQAHVTLKGTVLGSLDGDGHYVPTDASSNSELNKGFTLVKVSGEWRISSAPSGLLLTNDDFKRAYRPFDLYFAAYQSAGLVADQVRVPIDPSEGLAKSLVHRLLVGPTTQLRGAVASAFEPDVDVNDVSVEGDTVVVDFTHGIVDSAAGTGNREALSAQLSWTLKPLTESRRIEVRVNGEQFPGGPYLIDPRDYERFDPDVLPPQPPAYFLQQGKLHTIDKDRGNPLVATGVLPAKQFTNLAVTSDSAKVAALEKGGIWVSGIVPDGQWQRWMQGAQLTPPSWDRYGDLWSVARLGPHKSQVLRSHDPSRPVAVSAPDLQSTDVTAFRVARDGVRVAVVSDDGHGERVMVGSINRSTWVVQNLRPMIPANDGRKILDIAWQDADTLLVLSETKSGRELSSWSVTQGAQNGTAKLAPRIDTIAAAPDPIPVRAGTSDGELQEWNTQKNQWVTLVKSDAGAPVYPLG